MKNQDIRNFFGGNGGTSARSAASNKQKTAMKTATKRTAITDEFKAPVTPAEKRPRTIKVEKTVTIIELDSDINSDPEEPLSFKHRNKPKRIIVLDDEENAKPTTSEFSSHNFEPKYVYVIVAASGRVLYVGQGSYSCLNKREEMHIVVAIGQRAPNKAEGGWQPKHSAIQYWMCQKDGIKILKFERLGADAANVIESALIDATYNENYNERHESYNGIFEGVSYAGDPNVRPGLAELQNKLQNRFLAELHEKIRNDTSVLITASTFKLSYWRAEDGAKSNECGCGRKTSGGNLKCGVCANWPSQMPKPCKNFDSCGKLTAKGGGRLECNSCRDKRNSQNRPICPCGKAKVEAGTRRCRNCRRYGRN